MKDGQILVHKLSGTFAELIVSPQGYQLSFTIKGNISNTQLYSLDKILIDWREATPFEIEKYNKGELSID